ncbi:MAG: hypothetical protein RQ723_02765 [Desulfuromonadales bacterium]|nr:hypothetical protein [Desulfuromonadales bacterium]
MSTLSVSPALHKTVASLAILGCLLLFAACAPLLDTPPGDRVSDRLGADLLDSWRQHGADWQAVQGLAEVKVEAPGHHFSGNQVVLAHLPDRLRTESLSPFGTPLLTLVANGEHLAVLLPMQSAYYQGDASAANLQRFAGIPLEPEQLVGLLLCRLPEPVPGGFATYTDPAGGWLVDLFAGAPRQRLFFDAAGLLHRIEVYQNGRLLLAVDYRDHGRWVEGFPARYQISLPKFRSTARVEFADQRLNRPAVDGLFQLSPPPGVTVHELD